MTIALAALGWVLVAALGFLVLRLLRRLDLVAAAAHELRGSASSIELVVATLRRDPRGLRAVLALDPPLERMRAGLADLDAARGHSHGRSTPGTVALDPLLRRIAVGWRPAPGLAGRRMRLTWDGRPGVVRADRSRLAQAFSNLVANAVEHGSGEVELRGRRDRDRVVVEVRDAGPADAVRASEPDRGRGLAIAGRAVEEAGGRLRVDSGPGGTVAAIDLPAAGEGETT